jgi:predicted unusual protein kinase regulating ubiquinone biosynthesis (AarF/ABC1/UbiB family)
MFKSLKNSGKLIYNSLKLGKESEDFLKSKATEQILNTLSDERGIALKVAQMVGSENQQTITQGQLDQVISTDDIKSILTHEWQLEWSEVLESLNDGALVASIGQVHFAKLKNGDEVVIKIKYPDIDKVIQGQLKTLGIVGKIGTTTKLRKWGFKLGDYIQEFDKALHEEVDYQNELNNILKFAQNNDERCVSCIRPYENLCTKNIIVMTKASGIPFYDWVNQGETHHKENCAYKMVQIFFEQVLVDGFFQGDNQPGNYLFAETDFLPIDFGNMITLSASEKNALRFLCHEAINGGQNYIAPLVELGFEQEKLQIIGKRINLLMEVILEPITIDFAFNFSKWEMSREVDMILGDDKWWFRSSGSARAFQFIRSFMGLFKLLNQMGVMVYVKRIISDILYDLKVEPIAPVESFEIPTKAQSLNILVMENKREKVNLQMPARSVLQLEQLIDTDVIEKLASRGISVAEVKQNAITNGLESGTLFELTEGSKHYLVQLI